MPTIQWSLGTCLASKSVHGSTCGRDMMRNVREPFRGEEAMRDDVRTQFEKLGRHDRWLLGGNHDSGSKTTLLANDGQK
jgi:hypothetical protein